MAWLSGLFLTARDALTDRLSGFHAGGDDYLTKPFALAELIVRVQGSSFSPQRTACAAGSRRRPLPDGSASGPDRRSSALTPTEFRLLAALPRDRVMSCDAVS
jgi:two-component system response regulator MprA